jgi:NitT/TauT family transport system ATP-binding protein
MSSVIVTGISKSFASETGDPKVVLSDLNWTFEDGIFTSVVGPNGCGKSTLLNLIGGIMDPDAGEIKITTDHGRKPAVGYAWQDYRASLLPWLTVGENISFPLRLRGMGRQERLRAAEEALAGFAREINLHHPVYSLSGGQQQLVSLLRAMVSNPDVLLLDEPLSALDQSAGWTMASRIEQMWMQKRMPAIFVSHEIDEAVMLADRIVLMKARGGGVAGTIEHSMPRPRSVKMLTSEEHIRSRGAVIEFLFQEGAIRDAEGRNEVDEGEHGAHS